MDGWSGRRSVSWENTDAEGHSKREGGNQANVGIGRMARGVGVKGQNMGDRSGSK